MGAVQYLRALSEARFLIRTAVSVVLPLTVSLLVSDLALD